MTYRINWPEVRRVGAWICVHAGALIGVGILTAFVCFVLTGCYHLPRVPQMPDVSEFPSYTGKPGVDPSIIILGWVAAGFLVLGVVTLIASAVPVLKEFVPTRAAVLSIAAAVCLWVLQAALVLWLKPAVMVVGIGAALTGALVGVPWVIAYIRHFDKKIERAGAVEDRLTGVQP